jgi:putative oxidoreductase
MTRLRTWLRHPWSLRLSAWILGAVFLAAALPKLADPPGFAQALYAYRLLPQPFLAPLALALPWLEAGLALALLAGLWRRSASLLALLLLLVFAGALSLNLARGNPVDCGCFGASGAARSAAERLADMRLALARDALLALLALHLLATRTPREDTP